MDGEDIFVNESPSYPALVWAAIASVGWYILGIAVTLFFAAPYLGEKYREWRQKKDEEDYAAKYHKDPDAFAERLRAVEAVRQRMQEENDKIAQQAKQKEEERKELKRQELLKLMNGKGGQKLGTKEDSSLHKDYNPLMGDSSRGYKPPKRSCCGKGGCG